MEVALLWMFLNESYYKDFSRKFLFCEIVQTDSSQEPSLKRYLYGDYSRKYD
jgi:hypothetical protein